MNRWARVGAAVAALALTALPVRAHELHAIVVGFNRYQHLQKLLGAEADAADIAGVMRKRGVRDLVALSDPATKVADFTAAWQGMVAKANPGDTLLFTFAGHGIRVPETRTPKRTPDGFDKGFVFPTYDQDAAPDELLRDEDLYDLFKSAALRNLHVLFVADACHAGSGIRGTSPTAPVRFQRFNLRGSDSPPAPTTAPPPRPPLHSVAVLSAQIQEKAISEISVDGETRGALSYAVARGLEGAADPDGSGTITISKLYDYVRPIVRTRSGFSQAPTLYDVAEDADMPVFERPATQAAPAAAPAQTGFPPLKQVTLFTIGASAPARTTRSIVVAEKATAELIFDATHGLLLASTGDVLAFNFQASDVENAVAARQMLNALQTLADRDGALSLSLAGGDGLYVEGARAAVRIATEPFDNVAILDLTASGQLILLYPRGGERPVSHAANVLPAVQVTPPFGADYVVVLRSQKPLDLLLGAFSSDRQYVLNAVEGLAAMRSGLDGAAFRVGIQGIFTCKTATESGQCNVKASAAP